MLDHYGIEHNPNKNRQQIRCPMDHERRPSCSLNLETQLWNCFSCGAGGDVFTLIMEKENCDFGRARIVATEHGFATGGNGASDEPIRVSAYGSSRGVAPRRTGTNTGNSGYVPSWKRGRS